MTFYEMFESRLSSFLILCYHQSNQKIKLMGNEKEA